MKSRKEKQHGVPPAIYTVDDVTDQTETKPKITKSKPNPKVRKEVTNTVKAKNTRKKPICVSTGIIMPGEIGDVTPTELSTQSKYLEAVETPKAEEKKEAK